jgi:hypothetical protein
MGGKHGKVGKIGDHPWVGLVSEAKQAGAEPLVL